MKMNFRRSAMTVSVFALAAAGVATSAKADAPCNPGNNTISSPTSGALNGTLNPGTCAGNVVLGDNSLSLNGVAWFGSTTITDNFVFGDQSLSGNGVNLDLSGLSNTVMQNNVVF